MKTEIKVPIEIEVPEEVKVSPESISQKTSVPSVTEMAPSEKEIIIPKVIEGIPPTRLVPETIERMGETLEKLSKLVEKLKPYAERGLELTKKIIKKIIERKPVEEKEIEEVVGSWRKDDVKKILNELGIPVISSEEESKSEKERIAHELGIPVYSSEVTREKAYKAL